MKLPRKPTRDSLQAINNLLHYRAMDKLCGRPDKHPGFFEWEAAIYKTVIESGK